MDRLTDGRMNGWMDGWMERWSERQADERSFLGCCPTNVERLIVFNRLSK